jgi:adenylate cyclase
MAKNTFDKRLVNEIWYRYLTGEIRESLDKPAEFANRLQQSMFKLLPGAPRCVDCHVPLAGLGGRMVSIIGFAPSTLSPRLCNNCDKYLRKYEGGTEVVLSMLFADVRGSTKLAETLSAADFSQLIQRFYKTCTDVLIGHNALVNRLMGDQVIGLFAPRFAGSNHAKTAVEAALDLLRGTGHADPGGPWVPVGVSVHTGKVYVGIVGSRESVNEIAVLGNEANLAARLSSRAAQGEVVVSETTAATAGFANQEAEQRKLELKDISQPVPVRVLRVAPGT